jgi:hypothetical protein
MAQEAQQPKADECWDCVELLALTECSNALFLAMFLSWVASLFLLLC